MAITGTLTRVEIPAEVEVGQEIKGIIGIEAHNPGKIYWTLSIMVRVGNTPPKVLDGVFRGTKVTGSEHKEERTYNLGIMPNTKTTVTVRLLGHGDPGHTWTGADWSG